MDECVCFNREFNILITLCNSYLKLLLKSKIKFINEHKLNYPCVDKYSSPLSLLYEGEVVGECIYDPMAWLLLELHKTGLYSLSRP